MTDESDAMLVRGCLKGDPASTRELVARFESDVFAVCVRILRDRHEAEDVAQEVFLRVFRSLARWDASRPFRPWVLGIAVNRCRTALGKRGRRPETVDFLAETAAAKPTDHDGDELHAEIRAAVDDLRPDYREVFVLFHEVGRPYEEIAESVGRPIGTIKTWLHRARAEVLLRLRRRGLIPEPDEATPTRHGTR